MFPIFNKARSTCLLKTQQATLNRVPADAVYLWVITEQTAGGVANAAEVALFQ
jgi:hypothetical protein